MALSANTTTYLVDALTSTPAGSELASAIQSGAQLSSYTYTRLTDALSNATIAADVQAAMLGKQALSYQDIRYLVDALSSASVAANVIANIAGGVAPSALPYIPVLLPVSPLPIFAPNPPKNVSMPSGFSLSTSYIGNTQQQQVQLNFPAGSAFPSTGPGSAFQLSNAGNTNQYEIWYSVNGGSNTNPTPAGWTGIEVAINSSDSAATIAAKTQAAIAGLLAGMTSSAMLNVVTVIINTSLNFVATPTFSPIAGTYGSAQIVTISSTTATASLYYTLDGSTPTASSTLYVGPITVGVSETVKVLGIATGFTNSAIASAAYTISASPGVATQVLFTQEPIGAAQGVDFATMPIITIKDSSGDTITTGPDSTALVTLALSTGTGTLAGTVSIHAVAGVANFASAGLNISLFGSKILSATKAATAATGILIGYSTAFNISNGLAPLNLGTAANYIILTESGISTTAGSAITGNIAVSPIASTAITGFGLVANVTTATFTTSTANATAGAVYSNNGFDFTVTTTLVAGTTLVTSGVAGAPTASGTLTKVSGTGDATITYSSFVSTSSSASSSLVTGTVYAADYAAPTPANLTTAISNMQTAYTTGAGLSDPNYTNLGSGNLGGLTLVPGLYKWTTGVTIPTNVTLNGGPEDVFIFQISGTLNLSASTSILLSGGAVATNIFWVVLVRQRLAQMLSSRVLFWMQPISRWLRAPPLWVLCMHKQRLRWKAIP
jgi:hypothetical protein